MADAGCSSCIVDAKVEISHDDGVTYFEVPAVQRVTKTFRETTANETRHSHSGGVFVKPCGSDSRTPIYSVQVLFCNDDPLHWYLKDGDIVKVRITKGGTSPHSLFAEVLDAKYVDGGFDWDNTTEDGEEQTFTLESTSTPVASFAAWTGTPGSEPPYEGPTYP